MTWVKIDDGFDGHPKVVRAWDAEPASIGLHILALSHCAAYLTDGQVSEAYTKAKMPAPGRRRRAIDALLENHLWEQGPSGIWLIHDYLDFNESRERVIARRSSDVRRKIPTGIRTESSASRGRAGAGGPSPYPFSTASLLTGPVKRDARASDERQKETGNG